VRRFLAGLAANQVQAEDCSAILMPENAQLLRLLGCGFCFPDRYLHLPCALAEYSDGSEAISLGQMHDLPP
jgi:hypothetical protein